MNIRIQKVGIKVTMRSIAVGSKAQRIGQRKELNREDITMKDSAD